MEELWSEGRPYGNGRGMFCHSPHTLPHDHPPVRGSGSQGHLMQFEFVEVIISKALDTLRCRVLFKYEKKFNRYWAWSHCISGHRKELV